MSQSHRLEDRQQPHLVESPDTDVLALLPDDGTWSEDAVYELFVRLLDRVEELEDRLAEAEEREQDLREELEALERRV